jgi:branched-chain amino acid aminotransferase
MTAAAEINVTKVKHSQLKDISLQNVPFGRYFTDHMLEADYENGEWKNVSIRPYQPLQLSPALAAIHYGQSIFEGIKAYKNDDGEAYIFRPYENFKRFNISAQRMQMPQIPEEIFIDGLRQLITVDKDWIPQYADHALYIRPFMFSSDAAIGVRPSSNYKFLIILSPTGPYFSAAMRISVEEKYVRAAAGGVGFAKAAGNYGGAMYATEQAKLKGFDQVLWTDATEHKYVQECGVMNVFFIIDKTAITPDLESGTILEGVTRNSAIVLLKEMDYKVEERPISIDEIMNAYKNGTLKEVFGTGTAATISMIKELDYKGFSMPFNIKEWKTAPEVKNRMDAIKSGTAADSNGWMVKV